MKRFLRKDERGETYVEILVTVVILGLAGVAILGSLMTTIRSSTVHRNLANTETLVKSALEQAKFQIQLNPASPLFIDCASPSTNTAANLLTTWNSGMTGNWPAVPNGIGTFTMWVSQVECFSETSTGSSLDPNCIATRPTPTSPITSLPTSGGCSPNDNSGIVQLTVSVLDPSNQITSLSTLVRNPNYGSSYQTSNF